MDIIDQNALMLKLSSVKHNKTSSNEIYTYDKNMSPIAQALDQIFLGMQAPLVMCRRKLRKHS